LLKPLFGGLVDEAMGDGNSGPTALTDIIKFLLENIIVPFGGLLLLYSSYAGISSAALQGEMYGGKNQSYWVAIRTVIGFGMVTPAGGLKGLAVINLFLMTLTLHGVGAASSLWSTVVEQVTKNPVELTASSPSTNIFDTMLLGFMCAEIFNDYASGGDLSTLTPENEKTWTLLSSDSSMEVYGWTRAGARNNGGCGTITIKKDVDVGTVANLPGVNGLASIQATATASAKVQAGMQARSGEVLNTLSNRAAEVAKAMMNSVKVVGANRPKPDSYFQIMDGFRSQQQKAVGDIATTAMADVTGILKESAKKEGWVTAGFYFLGLGNFQQVVTRAINMNWMTSESTDRDTVLSQMDETYHGHAAGEWALMEGYINTGHKQMEAGRILPETVTDYGNNPTSVMQMIGKNLNDQVANSINNNATPLATAADLGSSLTTIGWGVMAGGTVVKVASKWIPGKYSDDVGSAGSSLFWIGLGIGFAGVALSFICLLPALYWGRRIISWIIRATVAQVGGPAWMILHVHHSGEGLTGNAGGGYMLATSLVLSPVLDIIGLAIAYLLMVVLSPFVTSIIMPNVTAQGSGTAALFAVFITAIVNAGLIIVLLELIGRIEHEVMAFVGGRGSDMNLDGDGDKNRMFALMTMASRKMPGPNMPSFGGGKKDDSNGIGKGGATVSGVNPDQPPKISTNTLLGKDK
jgi:conjugal transfer/type IV secretion protein DotA/TraY